MSLFFPASRNFIIAFKEVVPNSFRSAYLLLMPKATVDENDSLIFQYNPFRGTGQFLFVYVISKFPPIRRLPEA